VNVAQSGFVGIETTCNPARRFETLTFALAEPDIAFARLEDEPGVHYLAELDVEQRRVRRDERGGNSGEHGAGLGAFALEHPAIRQEHGVAAPQVAFSVSIARSAGGVMTRAVGQAPRH